MPGLSGTGGHRHPTTQRQLLRRPLPAPLSGPGGQGHRPPRHAGARRPGAGGGLGGKGLPRPLGHPGRTGLRGERPLPGPGDRGVQRLVGELRPAIRRRTGSEPRGGRPAVRLRLRRARRGALCPAGAMQRLWTVEAPPVRRRCPSRGLRRTGHRTQPGRRGGRAAGQRAALAGRVPGSSTPRPTGG